MDEKHALEIRDYMRQIVAGFDDCGYGIMEGELMDTTATDLGDDLRNKYTIAAYRSIACRVAREWETCWGI